MTSNRPAKLQQKPILATVLVVMCSACLLALTSLCLLSGCVAVFMVDKIEESMPTTIVDIRVAIDTSTLPTHPTEQDWFPIAIQALSNYGWDSSLEPVMLHTNLPCSSELELSNLHLEFAAIDFDGILPHRKVAIVDLDRSTSSATIWVYDAGLGLRRSQPLDFSKMAAGASEALEIADHSGGRDFRDRTSNACQISLWVRDYKWEIDYTDYRQPVRSELRIRVDARSGRVENPPE